MSHLNALPVLMLRDDLLPSFSQRVNEILTMRNRAHALSVEAEVRFEQCLGPLDATDTGESGFSVSASSLFGGRRRFDALPHNPRVQALRQHLKRRGKSLIRLGSAGFDVWLPTRFKRIPAEEGVELLDSSDLFEINPDIGKCIADGDFGDAYRGRVKAGWLLLARSGQIYGLNGSLTMATAAHEDRVISEA